MLLKCYNRVQQKQLICMVLTGKHRNQQLTEDEEIPSLLPLTCGVHFYVALLSLSYPSDPHYLFPKL